MALRIGIAGISGRMGRLLAEEVAAAGAELAGGITREGDAEALFAASDVVIDFTHASTVERHTALAARHGKALILGTTGLSAAQEAAVAAAAKAVPVVYAANFSPGVNLVFALAERMGAVLPPAQYDAEILEMHHRQKVDAPSGTAIAMGRAVAQGRGQTLEEAGLESGRDGHTGARGTGPIGFAALRGGQIVGEHSLIFTSGSEQIVLQHRSFDRRVYATGAVRAAGWAAGRAPGLYDMKHVLGMG
ncbi:4-hydroxy-tetrahydrodipicolinate reductase [Roseomonas sp. GC11]|uniref:4-hydroxy-tetrahydrodipicolinate reductase n=1 Tax=Roseomonas sp. GC11 TaxID=2950546 RepID=UPI00210D30A2|nr:4-hydroxy-tetrahydrodipicolinate reductase [Roseomonas sp. GC11]MCQ4162767.1 4-hydroxy-tetrahydrodipicolinate reductase [Roseomonas sp. GC11]